MDSEKEEKKKRALKVMVMREEVNQLEMLVNSLLSELDREPLSEAERTERRERAKQEARKEHHDDHENPLL